METKRSYKIPISLATISAIVIATMLLVVTLPQPKIVIDEEGYATIKFGFPIVLGAEADPGLIESGILEVFFVNYTVGLDPPINNDSSVIEGWAATVGYDGWNSSFPFQQQLKHSTTFYIIVRIRGNDTHAKRGADFQDTDLNVTWTSSDLGIGSDTAMSRAISYNSSGENFIWINFYDDNGGAGFTLTKDQIATIDDIKYDAYY